VEIKNSTKNSSLNKIGRLITFVAFIYFFYLIVNATFLRSNRIEKLLEDFTIVQGQFKQIGRFEIGINTSTVFEYKFNGELKTFKTADKLPCKNFDYYNKDNYDEIIEIRFPIAISNKDNSIVLPLLTKNDYQKIGESLPDSLSDVNEKFFDCTWEQKTKWK